MHIRFTLIFFILIFVSCDILNPEEELPAYIKIDKITLSSEPNALGLNDAWVYVDGNLQGVYELPAEFPVLEKGNHEIKILAGIKVNGIAATRTWYPFYNQFVSQQNLTEMSTTELNPVVAYNDDIYFMWEENFENLSIALDTAPGSSTNIINYRDDIFAGNASGAILLNPGDTYFECITSNNFPDLKGLSGRPVFLEMNYKNDLEFFVGMYIINDNTLDSRSILRVNKSENWNKIYIDLSNPLNDYQNALSFYFYFLTYKDVNDTVSSSILFDNLRIVLSQ